MRISLGPAGPFPSAGLEHVLDRQWLHYAFRSADGQLSMIANLSALGASDPEREVPQEMTILLLHDGFSWEASQFNAEVEGLPWSAFRLPEPGPALRITGSRGSPAVDLELTRTGRACSSQGAPFAVDQHLRWQSEPGVRAQGALVIGGRRHEDVELVGYHERVRGRWGWPELGGWVFGFANAGPSASGPPEHAVVFTLIQPPQPASAATGSVMLWRHGRLLRHFPRRSLFVEVIGQLDRSAVHMCPPLSAALGTPPTSAVPGRLRITAETADDLLVLDVRAETAARIVNPNERGLLPFSVHEVLGPCTVTGHVAGKRIDDVVPAVVEFAGGANVDP